MATWLAESSDIRPLPLRQPPATPVPRASPATAGTHRPGLLAAACPRRWPGTAPPRPEGGSDPTKAGDLRTRKTQGPLSLSPPLSDVRPPLAAPPPPAHPLPLAGSASCCCVEPVPCPRPPSGPQGALCPASRAGQARTLCPPQGLLSRPGWGAVCPAWAGGHVRAVRIRMWAPVDTGQTPLPCFHSRVTTAPHLVPRQVSAAKIQWRALAWQGHVTRELLGEGEGPKRSWDWGHLSGSNQEGPLPGRGCCWSRDRTGEEPGRALGETCVEPEDS